MKISSMANENILPSWALKVDEASLPAQSSEDLCKMAEVVKHIPEALSDEILVSERERIEVCASDESPYYYSSKWDKHDVSQLKEYASVCGVPSDKFQALNPDEFVEGDIEKTASSQIVKVASKSKEVPALKLNDPFHLEDIADAPEAENWEKVKPALTLADKPSMMSNAILSIGGGEDYLKNSDTPLAANQNSIVAPDTIKELAESDKEDNGVRLAREAKEREEAKGQRHKEWQEDKVKAMEHLEDLPKGTVFPTEVMNAQPGLNSPSSQMGVYANFDKDAVPEKTIGETLAEKNEERRQEIQGDKKEHHDFGIQTQAARSISDDFTDSLKQALNKE